MVRWPLRFGSLLALVHTKWILLQSQVGHSLTAAFVVAAVAAAVGGGSGGAADVLGYFVVVAVLGVAWGALGVEGHPRLGKTVLQIDWFVYVYARAKQAVA